jgi:hypothetical protein
MAETLDIEPDVRNLAHLNPRDMRPSPSKILDLDQDDGAAGGRSRNVTRPDE